MERLVEKKHRTAAGLAIQRIYKSGSCDDRMEHLAAEFARWEATESGEWDPMELEPLVDQMEHNARMDLVVHAMGLMSIDTIRDVCEQVLTRDDFEQLVHGWFRGWLRGLSEGSVQR